MDHNCYVHISLHIGDIPLFSPNKLQVNRKKRQKKRKEKKNAHHIHETKHIYPVAHLAAKSSAAAIAATALQPPSTAAAFFLAAPLSTPRGAQAVTELEAPLAALYHGAE